MKVVLGKRSLSKETEPGNHKMPIDFIDQLSKFEKNLLDIRRPFVIGALLTSLPIKIYKPKML
jgi:hypothetical protein